MRFMSLHSNTRGWLNGLAGVLIFSGSLPATRLAVLELNPVFLTSARAALAGLLALLLLGVARAPRPAAHELGQLALVALGVVAGFPLLTALALQHVNAAHSTVFIGMLPLATALFAVWRGGERLQAGFWIWAVLGCTVVAGFALAQGLEASPVGDGLMLAAVLVCGMGYAEGARLARHLGGLQVICWALVLALPLMLPLSLLHWPARAGQVGTTAWLGLGYVSLFSMFIGFVFWYRGLALGGIARVGQLQLLQPFFGLLLAAGVLGEQVRPTMYLAALGVVACVWGARRATPCRQPTPEPRRAAL
jgi:drug/metabolite transporter (DMT)-like permease